MRRFVSCAVSRREHQPADAGAMHFDAEIVALRMRGGERGQVLAVAEADLDDARRAAAEQRIEIQRLRLELDAVLRPQQIERALLRVGDAPGARDEGADGVGDARRSTCG